MSERATQIARRGIGVEVLVRIGVSPAGFARCQSPKGHWYPTRMRWTSSKPGFVDTFTDFYVEFDVEIPDALFDVKKAMPVEELFHKSP